MLLSLSDILATQSLDKVQNPASNAASNLPDNAPKFHDYLDKIPNKYDSSDVITPLEKKATIISGNVYTANELSDNVNSAVTDAEAKANQLLPDGQGNNAEALSAKQQATLDDLNNALSKLDLSSANLSADNLKALKDALAKIAEKGIPDGTSASDVVAQLVEQVKNAGADSTLSVDDILQKMNFANSGDTKNLTAAQLAAAALKKPAKVDIAVVSKVISAAKEEAAKPQIAASNVKLAQLETISNPNKKRSDADNSSQTDSTFLGVNVSTIEIPNLNKNETTKTTTEQLQGILSQAKDAGNNASDQKALADSLAGNNNIDPKSVSSSYVANNQQQTNTLINQTAESVRQVVAPANAKSDLAAANNIESASSNIPAMSSENFVKFQSMLEDSQAVTKNTTTGRLGSPDEIIAQIKFGMSGTNSKDASNISIQLHPKELGKVDIAMQMGSDGKTHVMVMAENTDTLNMLQKEASSLRDMLTDALKTDSGNLNFSFHQNGSDSWKQQFANTKFNGLNSVGSGVNGLGSDYLAAQGYSYNMKATQGLDIRV